MPMSHMGARIDESPTKHELPTAQFAAKRYHANRAAIRRGTHARSNHISPQGRDMSVTNPHPDPNEDPEQHIGMQTPDPWLDPEQTDWPVVEVNIDGMDGGSEPG